MNDWLITDGDGSIPIVVSLPHAGELIPDDIDALVVDEDDIHAEMLRDVDRFTDELWADAASLGAYVVGTRISRYVVDLNRHKNDISDKTVVGTMPETVVDGPRYGERGVIWRCTTTGRKVWKRKLSRSEYEARIARYHAPYHRLLAERLATTRDRHGHALLVDGHSMPSVGRVGHRDEGQRRADIVPGDRHGTSCSAEVSRIVVEHCEAHGLSVARNVPYAGGWITAHYGKPDTGIEAIQIEANRAIYMEEHSCDRRPAGIERLRTVFASLLPELARAR